VGPRAVLVVQNLKNIWKPEEALSFTMESYARPVS